MNKNGAGPNLTILIIGVAAFIMIITLLVNSYVDLMSKNGGTVDSDYLQQYAEISGYQEELDEFGDDISGDTSIWTRIPTAFSASFNALVIGIGGVTQFFSLLSLIPRIFLSVTEMLFVPAAVVSFVLLLAGVYITMKVYKAIRGSAEEP